MKKYIFLLLVLFPFQLSAQNQIMKDVIAEMNTVGCDKMLPLLQQKIKAGKATSLDHYKKAACELRKGQANVALQSLRACLALTKKTEPLYEALLFLRSGAYTDVRKLDSAIMDNQQLVKLYPKNVNYLINLSYLCGETAQYADCLAALEKARALDERNYVIYMNLAYYSAETEDYKGAIKYAEKGLTLTRDSIAVGALTNNLGFAQSVVVSPEKGLQTVQSSLRWNPRNAYAYFNIGRIQLKMKQKDKACASFLKAKELGGVNLTMNYLKKYCK